MSVHQAPPQEMPWETVIGLEVHAQISSVSKLFSPAPCGFGAPANTHVSLFDAAYPGTLPQLNKFCVEQALKTSLGLGGTINLLSVFDRKNYFYADLPSGYQISQLFKPLMVQGVLEIDTGQGPKSIGINRLHIEQDAGKSFHRSKEGVSAVDLNRAGVALMEIVSEPHLSSGEEAALFVKKLRTLLRYLGTCDGNMDEGSLRVDVNLSVRLPHQPLGVRTEIKNVNSVRFMQQAIAYETRRQIERLSQGQAIAQQTLLFDEKTGITLPMRQKESCDDYRYFPDPDLLPLVLTQEMVESTAGGMPELPDKKKKRFIDVFGLTEAMAHSLTEDPQVADFFEQTLRLPPGDLSSLGVLSPLEAAKWILGDIFALANKHPLSVDKWPLKPGHLAQILEMVANNTISGKIAKEVLILAWQNQQDPQEIVRSQGLFQVTDPLAIERVVVALLQEEPQKVKDYQSGKEKLFEFFVGQTMRRTQGKANPSLVRKVLKNHLPHPQ